MFAKVLLALVALLISGQGCAAWSVASVDIHHVQVGNDDMFYLTVSGDTTVSGCSSNVGWVAFGLDSPSEKDKALLSMALAAHMAGKQVTIGSTTDGCVSGFAHLNFIRIGTPGG